MSELRWQRLRPTGGIVAPRTGDAGYDVLAAETALLPAGKSVSIPTGVALQLPDGYMARVSSRSGFAFGRGAAPPQQQLIPLERAYNILAFHGTIDASYRGEIKVLLFNFSQHDVIIPVNTRIAQLVLIKVETFPLIEVTELDSSERGTRGFGSTGTV